MYYQAIINGSVRCTKHVPPEEWPLVDHIPDLQLRHDSREWCINAQKHKIITSVRSYIVNEHGRNSAKKIMQFAVVYLVVLPSKINLVTIDDLEMLGFEIYLAFAYEKPVTKKLIHALHKKLALPLL